MERAGPGPASSVTPRRVVVVGCCGSGKSTLARVLAERWRLVHIERDAHDHPADPADGPPLRQRASVLAAIAGAPAGWILDGAPYWYEDEVYPRVDLIVALDYPKTVVMWRCLRRTVRNILAGREQVRDAFASGHALRLAWRVHADRHREIAVLSRDLPNVLVLKDPRATRALLLCTSAQTQ